MNNCEGLPQARKYCVSKVFSSEKSIRAHVCTISYEVKKDFLHICIGIFESYTAALNLVLALLIPYGFQMVFRMDSLRSDLRFSSDRILGIPC